MTSPQTLFGPLTPNRCQRQATEAFVKLCSLNKKKLVYFGLQVRIQSDPSITSSGIHTEPEHHILR